MPKLTAAKAKSLTIPGMHGDGEGLYLNVTRAGSRSWVQRISIEGHRREIGLGAFPTISLARARTLAAANRTAVAVGRDPLAEKLEAKRKAAVPAFRQAAEADVLGEPTALAQRQAYRLVVADPGAPRLPDPRRFAGGQDRPRRRVVGAVSHMGSSHGDGAPGAPTHPHGAAVLRWCMAHGYVEHNAAGEAIDGALPPMPRLKAHPRALPYHEVAAALATVEASKASLASKLCLRFLILLPPAPARRAAQHGPRRTSATASGPSRPSA